ncbi:hypothetical protein EBU58_06425, partial [bacterium]|nr:hypothetical protein [bacterium]
NLTDLMAAEQAYIKAAAKAERDITVTYRLYPELGGERMKAEFDALLKQIQKELEKPADGLVALDGSAVGS